MSYLRAILLLEKGDVACECSPNDTALRYYPGGLRSARAARPHCGACRIAQRYDTAQYAYALTRARA
jgi:hypothetical protein